MKENNQDIDNLKAGFPPLLQMSSYYFHDLSSSWLQVISVENTFG